MEVQKEAFSGLMEYYKLLPTQNKRDEIISTLEELISNYTKICSKFGVMPDMALNKEILNKVSEVLKTLPKEEFYTEKYDVNDIEIVFNFANLGDLTLGSVPLIK